jgi:hypothetical protein
MNCQDIIECIKQTTNINYTGILAACAAVVAASSAFFSYRLSKKIYDEIKSDQTIIAGPPHHPGLLIRDHDDCVLRFSLFNKSHRKSYVSSVSAFDAKGNRIEIEWSNQIDSLGNILEPKGLIGIENEVYLAIRRNDGKDFSQTTIRIVHSFSKEEVLISYDPLKSWVKY